MIVVDASALVDMLTRSDAIGRAAGRALGRDNTWLAPEHLIVESCNSIRKQVRRREVGEARAVRALNRLARLKVHLLSVQPLVSDIWRLRHNATAYDAAYIVSAVRLGCTLVTSDNGLATVARNLGAKVDHITPTG